MNKKVLTVAQLRAIFKNCSLGLAVAGSALTAGKCKEGNPEEKKGKDGKSADSTTSNTDADAVKKTDLDAYAKKSDFINKLDSDAKLIIAGQTVDFSGLKGKEVTLGSLKDLLNEKGWAKNASTGVVSFTKDDVNGKTFAGVMGSSSTGVSLDSKDFKIDPSSGKLVDKDLTVDVLIKDKTVFDLIVDMINDKFGKAVDKNDAKIVVKGNPNTATPVTFDYKATFEKNEEKSSTNSTRNIEISKEFEKGAELFATLKKELEAEKNKTAKLEVMNQVDLLPVGATYARIHEAKRVLINYFKANPTEISLFKGCYSATNVITDAAALSIVSAASGNSFAVGDIFVLHEETGNTVSVVKTKVAIANGATALASASNPVDVITANAAGAITKTNSGFGGA